jgi:thioredoxin-like negative regulator of GroEL
MRLSSHAQMIVIALGVAVSAVGSAESFEQKKFDPAAFAAAQGDNKAILVDISATWCPTCKAQHKVLESLAKRPDYAELLVFEVDFDAQKEVVKSFNAQHQSTLIAFKGAHETRRLVGETGAAPIEELLKTALKP